MRSLAALDLFVDVAGAAGERRRVHDGRGHVVDRVPAAPGALLMDVGQRENGHGRVSLARPASLKPGSSMPRSWCSPKPGAIHARAPARVRVREARPGWSIASPL